MADVANTDNGQLRSDRSVELRVAAQLENLAVLRTLVAAVARSRTSISTPSPICASPSTKRAPG